MNKENFQVVELFELTFVDNSKLWATINCINGISKVDTICLSALDKGLNLIYKNVLKQNLNIICHVAEELSKNSDLITSYIDFVQMKSAELQKQLINAC